MACVYVVLTMIIVGISVVNATKLVGTQTPVEVEENASERKLSPDTTRERRRPNLMSHILQAAGIDPEVDGMSLTQGEDCARVCYEYDVPLICHFKIVLEHYHTMGPACGDCSHGIRQDCLGHNCITADGIERGVLSMNRQIPGPPIHVCKGDVVVVDVNNEMTGIGEALHWHGILQRGTPWMDGVPMLTQCLIQAPNVFRYAFVANDTGTKFYHSHSGENKVDGIFAPLIIRKPIRTEPDALQYECDNHEHVIVLSDWLHLPAMQYVPGLQSLGNTPDSLLINGRGRWKDPTTNVRKDVPLSIFRMNGCRSFRFRLINAANGVCPLQLQIERHPLTIIASDSSSVRPTTVDTLYSLPGERYDFVVHADQTSGNYWIRLNAVGLCEGKVAEGLAVLSYHTPAEASDFDLAFLERSSPKAMLAYPIGTSLNAPLMYSEMICGQRDVVCVHDLMDGTTASPSKLKILGFSPDYQFILPFNNYEVSESLIYSRPFYHHFMNFGKDRATVLGGIDNITFTFPRFPVLTQRDDIVEYSDHTATETTWCDRHNLPDRCESYDKCPCSHRLHVRLNSIVELILVDESESPIPVVHPFHLHGHSFYVLDMVTFRGRTHSIDEIREISQQGRFHAVFGQPRQSDRSYVNAPLKDTIQVPSSGMTRIRFKATNPGFWFMHCHIDWHMTIGMGLVIQVGDIDEMTPTPDNFPMCHDYAPDIDVEPR